MCAPSQAMRHLNLARMCVPACVCMCGCGCGCGNTSLVANSLIQAIQPCLNLAAISALFFLIFAILGVAFFGGRFHKCTDESRECFPEWTDDCPPELACTGMWTPPDATAPVPREWVNPSYSTAFPFSFDNVAVGMMTLFEVASLELWLDVM